MNAFESYRIFLALNNHFFQPSYDYFKYKGSVTIKPETFSNKRQDEKFRYETLGKKYPSQEELENFIVANLLEAKKRLWIGALAGAEPKDIYLAWQGRIQSLTYNLIGDLKRLLQETNTFTGSLQAVDEQHPFILKSFLRKEFSLESFVVLDLLVGFIEPMNSILKDDRSWMSVRNKAIKYRPFIDRLNINKSSISKEIQKLLGDLGVTT